MSSLQGGRAGTPVSRTCNRPWHLALIYFHINFSFIYSSHPSIRPFGQPSSLPLSIKPTRTASLHPSPPPLLATVRGGGGGPGPCLRVPGASPRLPTSLPFAVTERHRRGGGGGVASGHLFSHPRRLEVRGQGVSRAASSRGLSLGPQPAVLCLRPHVVFPRRVCPHLFRGGHQPYCTGLGPASSPP